MGFEAIFHVKKDNVKICLGYFCRFETLDNYLLNRGKIYGKTFTCEDGEVVPNEDILLSIQPKDLTVMLPTLSKIHTIAYKYSNRILNAFVDRGDTSEMKKEDIRDLKDYIYDLPLEGIDIDLPPLFQLLGLYDIILAISLINEENTDITILYERSY